MNPLAMNHTLEPRSALLSLPQEVRDLIYGLLLTTTFSVKNPRAGEIPSSLPLHQHPHLAILHVSRSMYEEAKRSLYRLGHFRFHAFSAGSPPLHEGVEKLPALAFLQDVTINLDVGTAFSFDYEKPRFGTVAAMLINHFARLDASVQRKRCVVEIDFVLDASFLIGLCSPAGYFKDALGCLTRFKTVEVKMGHLQMRLGGGVEGMIPLYDALDKRLAKTLGEGKGRLEERRFCLEYHPRRV